MSKSEQLQYLNYIKEGQNAITDAMDKGNDNDINKTITKYIGPNSKLTYRNGFLIPMEDKMYV